MLWIGPDYASFFLPICIFSSYVILQILRSSYTPKSLIIFAAILSGIALGVKITMLSISSILFFLAIGHGYKNLTITQFFRRSALFALLSSLTLRSIYLLQYLRSYKNTPEILHNILYFSSASSNHASFSNWIANYTEPGYGLLIKASRLSY